MTAERMTGPSRVDRYFEQSEHWSQETDPFALRLIERALAMLPAGVRSLLDVGCGDGELCRMAFERGIDSVGLDRSEAALAKSRAPKTMHGDATRLPFEATS